MPTTTEGSVNVDAFGVDAKAFEALLQHHWLVIASGFWLLATGLFSHRISLY
jgi:hypothetical protein